MSVAWPVLTERLAVRPVEAKDEPAFLRWRSLPEVVRYMYQPPWDERIAAERFADWVDAPFTQPGENLICAVALRSAPETAIGEVLLKWAPGVGQAEIGWAFHPDAAGHGYASEAAAALLRVAFERYGFHRVWARLDEENPASARVAERLGMRLEARFVDHDVRPSDRAWATELVYAVLASELDGTAPSPAAPRGTVWWDFDGTLAVREGIWSSALITALDLVQPGHELDRVDLLPGLDHGFPWHDPQTPHHELADAQAWWDSLHPVIVDAYPADRIAPDIARKAADGVRAAFLDPRHWTVLPTSRAALQLSRDAGLRNVVVSNHVPELHGLIDAFGLAELFDAVVNSAEVGVEKPHPLIFRAALEQSVPRAPIWMVGDNPIADIQGAAAFGVPGILVGNPFHRDNGVTALDAARQIVAGLG